MQLKKIVLFCCLTGLTTVSFAAEKTTYGRYEKVKVMDLGEITIPAKLDTGAMTASLNAIDIVLFEKDGKQWVRFTPEADGKKFKAMERPVSKMGKIKRRIGDFTPEEEDDDEESNKKEDIKDSNTDKPEYTYRPEIKMQVCLGNTLKTIDVNLTDRSTFRYPLLIGAKALRQFKAVVDPSVKYQSTASCSAK